VETNEDVLEAYPVSPPAYANVKVESTSVNPLAGVKPENVLAMLVDSDADMDAAAP
jgi:hypothetical protein